MTKVLILLSSTDLRQVFQGFFLRKWAVLRPKEVLYPAPACSWCHLNIAGTQPHNVGCDVRKLYWFCRCMWLLFLCAHFLCVCVEEQFQYKHAYMHAVCNCTCSVLVHVYCVCIYACSVLAHVSTSTCRVSGSGAQVLCQDIFSVPVY